MNNELEIVDSIDCNKEGPIEYPLFSCFSKNTLILNTWSEEELVYIDLDTRQCKKISLENKPTYYYTFGPLYWWKDPDIIIFYTPNQDTFVMLIISTEKFEPISHEKVKKIYPDFYNLYRQIKSFMPSGSRIKRVLLQEKEILIEDEASNKAIVKNFETGKAYSCNMPMVDFHDICYSEYNFIFVDKEIIFLENAETKKRQTLLPDEDYFLDAAVFLNSNTVVVLAGTGGGFDTETQESSTISSLSIYKI